MAQEVDRQALLTTLTTEHFTLQGARASTIAESSARSALYLGSLSASLVSLGFVAQISATGDAFRVFALVVLPTVFLLGLHLRPPGGDDGRGPPLRAGDQPDP